LAILSRIQIHKNKNGTVRFLRGAIFVLGFIKKVRFQLVGTGNFIHKNLMSLTIFFVDGAWLKDYVWLL
jgi:hypothetical protein